MSPPANQLLAYRFGSDASFEGQLVGALERIETGGSMRVVDSLFVGRLPESGEVVAIELTSRGAANMTGKLIGFRLDARERQAATRRAREGAAGEFIDELGALLKPGTAIIAVLVEHVWLRALEDAVTRIGGEGVASEFLDAGAIAEILPRLRAVIAQTA